MGGVASLKTLAEGDADMSLLPRVSRLAVGILVLLTLISLPTLRSKRNPGSALTPSIAWAGGSPDETLKPPADPPPKAKTVPVIGTNTADRMGMGLSNTHRSLTQLTAHQRWEIYYNVFRLLAYRF